MKKIIAVLLVTSLLCAALATALAEGGAVSGELTDVLADANGVRITATGYSVVSGESVEIAADVQNNGSVAVVCELAAMALNGISITQNEDLVTAELAAGEQASVTLHIPFRALTTLIGMTIPETVEINAYAYLPDSWDMLVDEYTTLALPEGAPAQKTMAAVKAEGTLVFQNEDMEIVDLGYDVASNMVQLCISGRLPDEKDNLSISIRPVVNGYAAFDNYEPNCKMDVYFWRTETDMLVPVDLTEWMQFIAADSVETLALDLEMKSYSFGDVDDYEEKWKTEMEYMIRLPYPPDQEKLQQSPDWPVVYEDERVCIRNVGIRPDAGSSETGKNGILLDIENKSDCCAVLVRSMFWRHDGARDDSMQSNYSRCAPGRNEFMNVYCAVRTPYGENGWTLDKQPLPENLSELTAYFAIITENQNDGGGIGLSDFTYYTPELKLSFDE